MHVELKIYERGTNKPLYDLQSDTTGVRNYAHLLTFMSETKAAVAQEVLKEELSMGFPKKFYTVVDGKTKRGPEYAKEVKPWGTISYIASGDVKVMIKDCYNRILQRSKVVSGVFINHNLVFFKGRMIASNLPELIKALDGFSFKMGDKLRFVNTTPYARRLEYMGIGNSLDASKPLTKNKTRRNAQGKTLKMPNGAYQNAYNSIKKTYKNASFFKFDFLTGSTLGINQPLQVSNGKKYRLTFDAKKWKVGQQGPYLYPVITVNLNADAFNQEVSGE